jgi:hypothetical protein
MVGLPYFTVIDHTLYLNILKKNILIETILNEINISIYLINSNIDSLFEIASFV